MTAFTQKRDPSSKRGEGVGRLTEVARSSHMLSESKDERVLSSARQKKNMTFKRVRARYFR